MKHISVIGGGAWGTALAAACVRSDLETCLWARETEVVQQINDTHENQMFLKGHMLPAALRATNDLQETCAADAILLVTPAQHLRAGCEALQPHLKAGTPVVICSKGIEIATGKLLSEVVDESLPGAVPMILSGPTFAAEVAQDLPCALTVASENIQIAEGFMKKLARPTFRLYGSSDIVGAQIGGAVKNVLAVATGIVAGLALGENARAAVITRGLAEMMRFGEIFGARRETLMGLSGLGDLILTCSSTQSRNMSLGKALGEGCTYADIMASRTSVAEGAYTVEIVHKIAVEKQIDMPITGAVYAILKEGAPVARVIKDLLSRPFTYET